jgi:hypothetical protein
MMEAVPKGWFGRYFELHHHRRPIATLDVSAWREGAKIEIGGKLHQFKRERMFGGAFLLQRGDEVLARATKPSALKKVFELEVDGRSFTFKRLSGFRREFGLFAGNQHIGGVAPVAWYTNRSVIRVPDNWSAAVQAFVFWLALISWKREQAAA